MALDLPGFGKAQRLVPDEPILPQLDDFAAAAIEYVAEEHGNGKRRAEVVIGGNSLGGTVALRAAERHGERIAGVVPIAPAGLDMPTWFTAIQGAPLVRAMLNSPVPVPERTLKRAMGSTYRVLAFSSPRKADDAVVGAFTQHYTRQRDVARLLGTGRTLLPELKAPFNFRNIDCPVMVVWGERDRMVASLRGRARRRRHPRHDGRAVRDAAATARRSRSPTGWPSSWRVSRRARPTSFPRTSRRRLDAGARRGSHRREARPSRR